MEHLSTDLLVIGSGAAGQSCAIQAAKLGKQVIVAEKESVVGGACINTGTIPSKSLREAIVELTRFHDRNFYGRQQTYENVSFEGLNYRLQKVLDEERRVLSRQFRKNGIQLVHGHARFISDREVIIEGQIPYHVTAEKIFIGSGSKPRQPVEVPFDGEVIFDSSSLLTIGRIPETMIVLGGGVIGSEYASFLSLVGSRVTVVDKREHMLTHLDTEIGIHLQTQLAALGLTFVGHRRPTAVKRIGDRVHVDLDDGSHLEADALLHALGRVANVDGMDLERAGLSLEGRGHLEVNPHFQTAIPHIYAAGDVIPGPALASTSMEQGRLAARHAFGAPTPRFGALFPLGIYTIPEISVVGKTEDELKSDGVDYEVGRAYYYEIARGHITGSIEGMFKIVFHAKTLKILGVHIIGRSASELIHIGQLAMTFGGSLNTLIDNVFNYPTLAEGYRIAAFNGLNKVEREKI
jgi:NAD(P) transhydrogenase